MNMQENDPLTTVLNLALGGAVQGDLLLLSLRDHSIFVPQFTTKGCESSSCCTYTDEVS